MYKKLVLLSALLCTWTQYAFDVKPWLEIKPSYFFFATSPMKQIYDNGGFQVQGNISIPLCNHLDFYGSVGYRKVSGNALNTEEKTTLTVIPVDIGLKPVFNLGEHFHYFFTIGPRYFYFYQHNNSLYVDNIVDNAGIGLFVNTGFNVELADCILLGIFGEYSYEKKKINPIKSNVYSNGSVQIGGFACGASLGYAF